MESISPEEVVRAFERNDLEVFTDSGALGTAYELAKLGCFLLMSSGNYNNLALKELFNNRGFTKHLQFSEQDWFQ